VTIIFGAARSVAKFADCILKRVYRYSEVRGVPNFSPIANENRLWRVVLQAQTRGGFIRHRPRSLYGYQICANLRVGLLEIGFEFIKSPRADRASKAVLKKKDRSVVGLLKRAIQLFDAAKLFKTFNHSALIPWSSFKNYFCRSRDAIARLMDGQPATFSQLFQMLQATDAQAFVI
jgi:hypothetical protein